MRQRVRDGVRGAGALLAFAPTRRLALVVALLSPLWLLSGTGAGGWIAAVALSLLALLAGLDAVRLPAATDVTVTRRAPETIGVGDREEAGYAIASHWNHALLVSPTDLVDGPLVATEGAGGDVALPARRTVVVTFDLVGRARGQVQLGGMALRVRTSLGLVSRTLRYDLPGALVVAPSLAGVRRFRWLAVHHRLAAAGVRDARRRGEGRSFARLRDYVAGDDPRHIDWKATARRGHPITREFTIEQSQTVYILVDAGRSMTQLAGAYPRFEYALSSALVLADVVAEAGDRVGLLAFDDRIRALVPAQRGRTALQAIRTALVPIAPALVEPDYAAAFRALASRQRKRALIVMLTDVIDSRAARTLIAHLGGRSRHLAVVVALRNDALGAAASRPASTRSADWFAMAAAEELLADRATALQRMRDAGLVVLDVAPDAMAAAVVSQYLALKARGAL